MNFKNVKAERTTITRDTKAIEDQGTGNIFESIVVLSKRSNQLAQELKKELAEKMSKLGKKLILEALKLIEEKQAVFVEQKELEATYAKKIEKSECKINWDKNANEVIAKINALNSNLGSWFEINGNK